MNLWPRALSHTAHLFALAALGTLILATPHKEAHANDNPFTNKQQVVQKNSLNGPNIRQFLETTKTISMGKDFEASPVDIADYLDRHLTEKSEFSSTTHIKIPGYPAQDGKLKVDKEKYIADILKGQGLLEDYETTLTIDEINIAPNGRSASLKTTSTERGKLLWPDGKGGKELVPVAGESICDQQIVLSAQDIIQMAGAVCRTDISFSPYEQKKLTKQSFEDAFYEW